MNDPRDDGGRAGIQVSVLLPAYNERENLAELLPETRAVLEQTGLTHEIIVVDDGSTDGTRELMRQCTLPGVVSIRFRRNAGKSAALDAGLARAQGEYIVLMDADGQDDPREIPKLIAALESSEELDLVTGRRNVRHDRMVKRTTSRLYNRATSMVAGVSARDFNSGPEGDAARARQESRALRGAAPVHPGAGALAWLPCRRGRRRAPRPPARRIEVRAGPLLARVPRPHHGEVPDHLHRPSLPPLRWDRRGHGPGRLRVAGLDAGRAPARSPDRHAPGC